jgi:hypothetical protein
MKEPARRCAVDGEYMDGTTYQKPEPDYSLVPDPHDAIVPMVTVTAPVLKS